MSRFSSKQAVNKPDYSTFDLSHLNRTSFDMGKLIPIACIPTLPGDRINADVSAFVRGMPTLAPILDKVDIKINHFYVPYRVLWTGFEEFITQSDLWKVRGQAKPQMPTISANQDEGVKYPNGRLADYLGIPTSIPDGAEVSAMPFLAYNRIYLDYFAPQRWVQYLNSNGTQHPLALLNSFMESQKEHNAGGNIGNMAHAYFSLKTVGWNHDYFTNALPTPSLFDDVNLPLFNEERQNDNSEYWQTNPQSGDLSFNPATNEGAWNDSTRATVRDLRKSIALQHYLEKMAVGGGRYQETMKVLWNQDLSNKQLQRSEYLGGDVIPLFVNEVEATAGTAQTKLGDLAGKPVGGGKFGHINFEADEHGIYMVLAHVVPKRSYTNQINKMWTVKDPLDLPTPEFEGIGDQAVFRHELTGKYLGLPTDDIFGYVPRYSEYKGHNDTFSGEMRYSLLHWHMGTTETQLEPFVEISPEFIDCNPRTDIFQVTDEPDKMLGTFQFNIKAKRKLSMNPLPGISRI